MIPAKASSAILLHRLGRYADARQRLLEQAAMERQPSLRDGCLRAAAGVDLDWAFQEDGSGDEVIPRFRVRETTSTEDRERATREAVGLLRDLARSGRSPYLRWYAQAHIRAVCAAAPEARGWMVGLLLGASSIPDAAARAEAGRWETALRSDDLAMREMAQESLRVRREDAIPVLRVLLESSDPEVRARALAVLEDLALP